MKELGTVEASPKVDGRNMVMVLAPIKQRAKPEEEEPPAEDDQHAAAEPAPSQDATS
jgi:translation initiation factor IF-3